MTSSQVILYLRLSPLIVCACGKRSFSTATEKDKLTKRTEQTLITLCELPTKRKLQHAIDEHDGEDKGQDSVNNGSACTNVIHMHIWLDLRHFDYQHSSAKLWIEEQMLNQKE